MNPVRKRKLFFFLFALVVLAVVSALILYALRQNINLFYSPSQVKTAEISPKTRIRVGGMVEKNSVSRDKESLFVTFKLTDYKNTIEVSYKGILPDLFREEQGIVALGHLKDKQHFVADEVLAKHDENYMPPEVKQTLQKS
ncbi:MAG: cytochrome c maturation protein CcmE [Proteobacteria bacterium]|nr:cytochrome c maturation protein CcmE [Pseudomonadota bacterium]